MNGVLRPDPIVRALQGAFCRDASRQELLALVAGRIHDTGSPYGGVRVYLLEGDAVAVEARAGNAREAAADVSVPIRRHDDILGGIDVRSDGSAPFDPVEEEALGEIADALAVLV